MRITGGQARGTPLKAPKGLETRPTSDKVREAVFSTLGDMASEARVLDLFAGSGALGIEALSRGADFVVFIEKGPAAARVIAENLTKTHFTDRAQIIQADFRPALKMLHERRDSFQLILMDPPYEGGFLHEAAKLISIYSLLAPNGTIVAEHFKKVIPPAEIGQILLSRTRSYGQTAISYYFGR